MAAKSEVLSGIKVILKAVGAIIGVLAAIGAMFVLIYLLIIALIVGDISEETVILTLESPNGTYIAQVIDNDSGALGGDTFVEVYENKWTLFGEKRARVYNGDWLEYERLEISWQDDSTLLIYGREYYIPEYL